jgi:hypothetical protein
MNRSVLKQHPVWSTHEWINYPEPL